MAITVPWDIDIVGYQTRTLSPTENDVPRDLFWWRSLVYPDRLARQTLVYPTELACDMMMTR